jgi:hypothetical protein
MIIIVNVIYLQIGNLLERDRVKFRTAQALGARLFATHLLTVRSADDQFIEFNRNQ